MSRRIGKENVKTQQETGAVCCEASQKGTPQMAAESHKGKRRVQSRRCHHAALIVFRWRHVSRVHIQQRARTMMTHHRLVHQIAVDLAARPSARPPCEIHT